MTQPPQSQDLAQNSQDSLPPPPRFWGQSSKPTATIAAAPQPEPLPNAPLEPPAVPPANPEALPTLTPVPPAALRVDPVRDLAQSSAQSPDQGGNRWQRLSLRLKATIVVLALVLVPVAGLGVAATVFAGRSLEARIKDLEEDTTRAIADKVAFFLKERYGDIQALSNSDFLRNPNLLAGKLQQPDREANKLDQFLQAYGVYDSIAVYDREGNFRIQSRSQGTPRENIRSQKDQAYFQQILATGEPYLSQPFIPEDADLAKYSIFLAAPIRANGQIVGVVRARMPVRYMSNVLASQQQNEGGSGLNLYLTDQQGLIFASSNQTETATNRDTELQATTLFPNFDTLQSQNQIQTLTLGRDRIVSYVPLNQVGQAFQGELPELGWSTLASISQAEAFVPLQNLRTTLVFGTLVAMVGISLVVVSVINRLVQPLIAATRAVTQISQGDFQARLAVQGKDEIAQLGNTINSMAEQIELLLAEQAKLAEEAKFLAEVSSLSVDNSGELENLFYQSLQGAQMLLGVDRLVLYQIAPDSPKILAEVSQVQSLMTPALTFPALDPEGLARYSAGQPIVISNLLLADMQGSYMQWLNRAQVRASLEIPLETGDDRQIVLMIHDCHSSRDWLPTQLNFGRELANRLATALSRVSFLEQLNLARQQAESLAVEQTNLKEALQRRALELLMEVDPVSQGDLTIRAKVTEDEIGTVADSYNATIESLRSIVQQVQSAAEQVALTARNSEPAVGKLSTGASTQTQELALALQRIEEMARSIEEVATNAKAAEQAVQQASQTVQEGDQAMNRTVDGILAIRETVGETAKKVKRLGESSQRISKVVNLISSFAAQTNLLALNASIEAARAGEEGRGFAVVADEVRSLARQSADATAEIEKLVAGIQAETQEVVAAMEAGTEQVVTGTQLVDATRQSLNRIADTSQEISRLVDAIATAADQQSTASTAVTHSMTGLATIAQETSTEAEQVANSFQKLLSVAQTLQAEVARFKVS